MKYILELVVHADETIFNKTLPENLETIYKAIKEKKYYLITRSEKDYETKET